MLADLRDPEAILSSEAVQGVLDLRQPAALMLVCVHDEFQPAAALATLLDALPSGSYLAASHATAEHLPVQGAAPRAGRGQLLRRRGT